ncbi:MAG TPA: cadherin-like domain-containing protein, partial [Rubrobacter sp.]|nr:cadherin-like domain-containing protein [Rubrobacter sp.]
GPGRLLEQLKTNLREAFEHVPSGTGRHLGIGLALPAPILLSEGIFFSPPSFPGWGRLQLGDMVAEEYGFQVLVDNDANCTVLYTPDKRFKGTDTFTYTATDGQAESAPATVTIQVTASKPKGG